MLVLGRRDVRLAKSKCKQDDKPKANQVLGKSVDVGVSSGWVAFGNIKPFSLRCPLCAFFGRGKMESKTRQYSKVREISLLAGQQASNNSSAGEFGIGIVRVGSRGCFTFSLWCRLFLFLWMEVASDKHGNITVR